MAVAARARNRFLGFSRDDNKSNFKNTKGCLSAALDVCVDALPYLCRSKRSRFMTLVQAAMKSVVNFSLASAPA
jgi:hypothetical protein